MWRILGKRSNDWRVFQRWAFINVNCHLLFKRHSRLYSSKSLTAYFASVRVLLVEGDKHFISKCEGKITKVKVIDNNLNPKCNHVKRVYIVY